MNEFFEAIKAALDWYMSTALPKDTAVVLANIVQYAGNLLSVLVNEYIAVIFG